MSEENTPYYPEQGSQITADAVRSLLPAGLDISAAKILFVHAHPDDESTSTGATMGYYAHAGAEVDLITATRGEMGEVIPEDLKHLEAWHPSNKDGGAGLGRVREAELAHALKILGVKQHSYLGQGFTATSGLPERYPDSGMSWGSDGKATVTPDASEGCLTRSPIEPQSHAIAAAIRQLRPDVLVTYDAGGGYGHPDHVRAHEMTIGALRLVMGSEYEPKMVWGLEGDFDPEDTRLQAVIDGDFEAKRGAMAAHATQVTVLTDSTFEYSNKVEQKISARETFRLLYSGDGVEADRSATASEHARVVNDSVVPGLVPTESATSSVVAEDVVPSKTNSTITAVAMGILAGMAGTLYHAYIWYQSENFYLPWGAILAVLTLLLSCIWVNVRGKNSWPGVICGVIAFLLTFAFSTIKGKSGYLLVLNPDYPIGIAGIIWSMGTLVATVLATIGYGIYSRKRKLRQAK